MQKKKIFSYAKTSKVWCAFKHTKPVLQIFSHYMPSIWPNTKFGVSLIMKIKKSCTNDHTLLLSETLQLKRNHILWWRHQLWFTTSISHLPLKQDTSLVFTKLWCTDLGTQLILHEKKREREKGKLWWKHFL